MVLDRRFGGALRRSRQCFREARPGVRGGFTLIELLVVVAIIVVLIAILIPSLGRAKEQAKTVQCSANLRQVGQIVRLYATEHDGRGPGGATGNPPGATDSSGNQYDSYQNSAGWADTLNREVLGRGAWGNANSNTGVGFNDYSIQAGHTFLPSQKVLCCPNFQPVPYTRPWGYNLDLAGGPNGAGAPWGIYATQGPDPGPITCWGQTFNYCPGGYFYGAKIDRFRSGQFMIREFDYSNDTTDWSTSGSSTTEPNPKGSVTLGGGSGAASYTASTSAAGQSITGQVSFRHPYGKKGTFLYMDAHVEVLSPKDDVYSRRTMGLGY